MELIFVSRKWPILSEALSPLGWGWATLNLICPPLEVGKSLADRCLWSEPTSSSVGQEVGLERWFLLSDTKGWRATRTTWAPPPSLLSQR